MSLGSTTEVKLESKYLLFDSVGPEFRSGGMRCPVWGVVPLLMSTLQFYCLLTISIII